MARRYLVHSTAIVIAMVILVLIGCRAAREPGAPAQGTSPSTPAATEPLPAPLPTRVVESTIPAQPSPAASATLAPTAQEEATTTPTNTPAAAVKATASSTAVATAPVTRPASGVVVTSEPRVDVWTYGTGVVSTQIEGPLQTTIGFLNSLIVDGAGNGSLSYLDQGLHAEALANPNDNLVLGIDVAYTSFEVNWLGASGATGQVEAVLLYEGGGQAAHHFDLRRNGDTWQITKVAVR